MAGSNHNGTDVKQTKQYIKIHCQKYITKMTQSHQGVNANTSGRLPLPFPSDKNTLTKLLQCPLPATDEEKQALEKHMRFKY
jgi:hypothetical protein